LLNIPEVLVMLVRAVVAVVAGLHSFTKARAVLQMENIALRHQLSVLRRTTPKRPKLNTADLLFWIGISRLCSDWRSWLIIVQPETVVGWHRKLFRAFWTWKVRAGKRGRPTVEKETRELIRRMSRENPTWGAPRIHGELLKLGIQIAEAVSVSISFDPGVNRHRLGERS